LRPYRISPAARLTASASRVPVGISINSQESFAPMSVETEVAALKKF